MLVALLPKYKTHQFSASITFHGLRLAVAREVIWSAALITSGRTRAARVPNTKSTEAPASRSTSAPTYTLLHPRVGTRALRISSAARTYEHQVATNSQQDGQVGHRRSNAR